MKIVFATNNAHKLREIRQILGEKVEIVSLKDIGCYDDIPETGDTLEANSMQKARYIFDRYALPCFADDTGLEVDALQGAPGVHSARYADERGHDSEANMAKLLEELGNNPNRAARFRTVITFIEPSGAKNDISSSSFTFEGIVEGSIARAKQGSEGFGYDPLFIPKGYTKSFAQLGEEAKNKISHRAIAVKKFADFLAKHPLLGK